MLVIKPALKSYLITYFSLLLVVFLTLASLNYVVDPYNIFRAVEIPGFNREKPDMDVRGLSRVKAIDLATGDYDTLILGTSRVFWGINPENPVFGSEKVYNAGILSTSSYQIHKVFEFARQHQRLKTVVLGLDINAFDAQRPWVLPDQDFNQSAFVSKFPLLENLKSLLSYDALIYSWQTFQFNRQGKRFDKYTAQGFIKPESFTLDRNKNFQLVAQKIQDDQQSARFSYNKETLQFLIDIVKVCDQNNIELKLFIEPTHAIMQDWIVRSGNLPTFETWKRALAIVVHNYGSSHPGSIVLWDFTGKNPINNEKIPTSAQPRLRWYIDPVHYTPETGAVMMARIFNQPSVADSVAQDFGVMINTENIDAHLLRLRKEQSR